MKKSKKLIKRTKRQIKRTKSKRKIRGGMRALGNATSSFLTGLNRIVGGFYSYIYKPTFDSYISKNISNIKTQLLNVYTKDYPLISGINETKNDFFKQASSQIVGSVGLTSGSVSGSFSGGPGIGIIGGLAGGKFLQEFLKLDITDKRTAYKENPFIVISTYETYPQKGWKKKIYYLYPQYKPDNVLKKNGRYMPSPSISSLDTVDNLRRGVATDPTVWSSCRLPLGPECCGLDTSISHYKNFNPIYGLLMGIFMYDGIPGPWGQLWIDEEKRIIRINWSSSDQTQSSASLLMSGINPATEINGTIETIFNQNQQKLYDILDNIENLTDYLIVVEGHSMGGAMSQYCSSKLLEQYNGKITKNNLLTVVLGAPRFASQSFYEKVKQKYDYEFTNFVLALNYQEKSGYDYVYMDIVPFGFLLGSDPHNVVFIGNFDSLPWEDDVNYYRRRLRSNLSGKGSSAELRLYNRELGKLQSMDLANPLSTGWKLHNSYNRLIKIWEKESFLKNISYPNNNFLNKI